VNLLREGIDPQSIFHVGNVMIDTLVKLLPAARAITWPEGLVDARYLLVTLHRPSNVDNREMLTALMKTLDALAADIRIVFPVHPRTRKRIEDLGLANVRSNVRLIDPVGYLEFLSLQTRATAVVTDSGGIQEETTYLGVPCLTVRENTERPVTVTQGTNILVGQNMTRLLDQTRWILKGQVKTGTVPALWDGHASDRIADLVVASLVGRQAQQLAG
jgi:UDP-N-acetylglucosamine 2-epimerase (non-hydrolysing)